MQWVWDQSPLFQVFGHTFRYYGVLYFITFVGAWFLMRWQVVRAGGPDTDADRYLVFGMIATWVGGRLGHMVFYDFAAFSHNPWIFFEFKRGGLASHGAAVALAISMWVFSKWRHVSFIEGCDRVSFSVALGTILVRVGNFMNSEVVGRVTDQTWGVRFPRYDHVDLAPLRHPSQIYEVVLGCVLMASLVLADRLAGGEKRPRGLLISVMLTVYFAGRFVVEFFKERQALADDSFFTMGQILSFIPFAVGVVGLVLTFRFRTPAGWGPARPHEP
ncbi:MAG: prolipoprotein diacylglyceryl transferase [bacterium]